jgi:hypothetical protein
MSVMAILQQESMQSISRSCNSLMRFSMSLLIRTPRLQALPICELAKCER